MTTFFQFPEILLPCLALENSPRVLKAVVTRAVMDGKVVIYLAVFLVLLVLVLAVCLWLLGTAYLYQVHKRFAHIPRPKMPRYDMDCACSCLRKSAAIKLIL